MMTSSTEIQNSRHWIWFRDKILPSLVVAMTISIVGASLAIWRSVAELTNSVDTHERRIEALQQDISIIQLSMITRNDLLEVLKRVEQQLQIVLLQAGVNKKITLE